MKAVLPRVTAKSVKILQEMYTAALDPQNFDLKRFGFDMTSVV